MATVVEVVRFCQRYGVSVEAELGRLGGQEDDVQLDAAASQLTDLEATAQFVTRSEPDSLAVASGSAHGLYRGMPHLDFTRLAAICQRGTIPQVREAIALGSSKVCMATECADTLKRYFQNPPEANALRQYMTVGKQTRREVIAEKIGLCGSAGRV